MWDKASSIDPETWVPPARVLEVQKSDAQYVADPTVDIQRWVGKTPQRTRGQHLWDLTLLQDISQNPL